MILQQKIFHGLIILHKCGCKIVNIVLYSSMIFSSIRNKLENHEDNSLRFKFCLVQARQRRRRNNGYPYRLQITCPHQLCALLTWFTKIVFIFFLALPIASLLLNEFLNLLSGFCHEKTKVKPIWLHRKSDMLIVTNWCEAPIQRFISFSTNQTNVQILDYGRGQVE